MIGATVLGFTVGIVNVGYQKYSQQKRESAKPSLFLRLLFDGHPQKLINLLPFIIFLAMVIAAMTA